MSKNARPKIGHNNGPIHEATLRDMFAAAALTGMLAQRPYDENMVAEAFRIADEMLKGRFNPQGE
jgi:hypothetical protein